MIRSGRVVLHFLIVLMVSLPAFGSNQVQPTVPSAPVPAQLVSAKRVFVRNAGVNHFYLTEYVTDHTGSPNGLYDEFYAAIKNEANHELVEAPGDADVIFEISLMSPHLGEDPEFQLRVLDPKTQTCLWNFVQLVPAGSGGPASRRKAWDKALAVIVHDLHQLVTPQAAKN